MNENAPNVYIGLLHYPVYNRNMETIATSITNIDIHDIARTACTYGVKNYFVVHPQMNQRNLISNILDYWQKGFGAQYHPDRKTAFENVMLMPSLEDTKAYIANENNGVVPKIVTTDARVYPNTVSYHELRDQFSKGEPYLILFGTGWGMDKELMEQSDYILEPIYGAGDYNHLSVRGAVAIILDRLLSEPWWKR